VSGVPACRTACPDLDGDHQVGSSDIQVVADSWPCGIEVTAGISHPWRIPQGWHLTAADPDPDGDPNTPNYGAAFDRDGDGVITVADIMHVAVGWGQGCR